MGAVDLQLGHQLREPRLSLQFIPAPEEPPIDSPEHEQEVRQVQRALEKQGLRCNTAEQQLNRSLWSRCGRPVPPDPATIVVELAEAIGPTATAPLGAWLHGRAGRKIRLKVSRFRLDAEAQTAEEVANVLARAQELQQLTPSGDR